MPATQPTILATSGGFFRGQRTTLRVGPLLEFALELAEPPGVARLCFIGTALGDQSHWNAHLHEAFYEKDVLVTCLNLYPMPNFADVRGHLRRQDVIWVGGGSTANLLALWRLHGLDSVLRECWEAGVVLGGVSAGSICWHQGGTTDSFGPDLVAIKDGLGLIPASNCVHYDAEEQRRPLYQRLVATGEIGPGYATENGVGLLYRGCELAEAVTEVAGRRAYRVEATGNCGVLETPIEARPLPGALGFPRATQT